MHAFRGRVSAEMFTLKLSVVRCVTATEDGDLLPLGRCTSGGSSDSQRSRCVSSLPACM